MSKNNNLSDYTRICTDCEHHTVRKGSTFHTCTLPVEVVTGRPAPVSCYDARNKRGHCGPGGRNFEMADTVPVKKPRLVEAAE